MTSELLAYLIETKSLVEPLRGLAPEVIGMQSEFMSCAR